MNVDETQSPSDLLKQIFFERNRHNPRYSLRAFARDLKISHTYLSLVFNGKKRVHPKRAVSFAQALKLDASSSEKLQHAIHSTFLSEISERPPTTKDKVPQRTDFFVLELDRFRLMADWYHLAILDLTLLPTFRPSFAWISGQLGIKPTQAKTAVKRLMRLGLLESSESGWKKSSKLLSIPATASNDAIRRFHRQMIYKAADALSASDEVSFANRHIVGTTMAIDSSKLPAAKRRIERFRRKLIAFLCEGEPDRLFQLNLQVFPLDQTRKAEEPE